jgi:hypothetical protein
VDDVVQMGDSGYCVSQGVGGPAVVTEDLPALHSGRRVPDPGADLAVGGVQVFLPVRQIAAVTRLAERHDHIRVPCILRSWNTAQMRSP